ncbi:MAG: 4Fe-4S dicluster domain-containing protein [Desulfovibrionales bacterium]|nr:4Fe-4S dicluster domain-containing protein [Desulfovibrionales bacterium]
MSQLDTLKSAIKDRLGELECVIGWEQGYDPLHATPLFIRTEADLDRLIIGPLAVHNLATYLTAYKGKKIGVVVKGCDSRSVIELLNENLISRDDLVIFGLCCDGVVSQRKIRAALPADPGFVEAVDISANGLKITVAGQTAMLNMTDILADKCRTCQHPNALISDVLIGENRQSASSTSLACQEEFEAKSDAEKFAFWQETMSRCIRCYACRNACPMCVCRDYCIATSRDPLWVSQDNSPAENFMFQMIHVSHLAGRCTECGECERACPVDIPLMLLRRFMNKQVQDVFEHQAGTDLEQTPPLLTFKVEEERINERGW